MCIRDRFKRWFGDWENDPANASKVVDENGEPLVVYHGSPAIDIESFDRSKDISDKSGLKEVGTYFSTNPELAEEYAKKDINIEYIEAYEKSKEDKRKKLNDEIESLNSKISSLVSKLEPIERIIDKDPIIKSLKQKAEGKELEEEDFILY